MQILGVTGCGFGEALLEADSLAYWRMQQAMSNVFHAGLERDNYLTRLGVGVPCSQTDRAQLQLWCSGAPKMASFRAHLELDVQM